MATVECVHCNAINDPVQTSGYCEECGKRLPGGAPFSSGPSRSVRINKAVSEEREKAINRASGVLFAVAIIQLLCGGGFMLMLPMLEKDKQLVAGAIPMLMAVTGGVFGVFLLLGLWARFQPLPPSIIGLIIYVPLTILDLITSGGNIASILVKIFIIVGLVNAVTVAAKVPPAQPESYADDYSTD